MNYELTVIEMRVSALEKFTDGEKLRESNLVSRDEFERVCGDLRVMVAGFGSLSKI